MNQPERLSIQTRIPAALRVYLKAYSKQHQMSLEAGCQSILGLFIKHQPWLQGLQWRVPLSNRTDAGESQGWSQLNVFLSPELAAQLESLAQQQDISRATVLYTGLFWFAKFISPPVMPA